MLIGMPGIPCIYYGSEWGTKALKSEGDPALRPCFDEPVENELTSYIKKLCEIRKESETLCHGTFRSAFLTNKQCIMEREWNGEKMFVAINAEENSFTAYANFGATKIVDMITGKEISTEGSVQMEPYSAMILKKC